MTLLLFKIERFDCILWLVYFDDELFGTTFAAPVEGGKNQAFVWSDWCIFQAFVYSTLMFSTAQKKKSAKGDNSYNLKKPT